jgi:hypothetical protein
MHYFICRDLELKISPPLLTCWHWCSDSALQHCHWSLRVPQQCYTGMCHCPVLAKQLLAVTLDSAYQNILNNRSLAENTVAKSCLHFTWTIIVIIIVVFVVVCGGGKYMLYRAGSELYDSQDRQRVKCGNESRRNRKQEWLCWRWPTAIYMTDRS